MNRFATRCMLIALALTIPAVTALAEDANANSLLGKPTRFVSEPLPQDDSIRFGDDLGVQLSPDGRWLIYFKATAPPAKTADEFLKQVRARAMQPGKLILRNLKTGREQDMLKETVKRYATELLPMANCFRPGADQALISIMDVTPGDEDQPFLPSNPILFRVSLGAKCTVNKQPLKAALAFGTPLKAPNTALVTMTDDPKPSPDNMPEIKLVHFSKDGQRAKSLGIKGVPLLSHPTRSLAVVCLPRLPRGDEPEWDNDQAWHPPKLQVIDPNSGKVLQQPNLHPKHHMCRSAFFLDDGKMLVYDDTDQVGSEEVETYIEDGDEIASVTTSEAVMQPATRVWDLQKKNITREFKNCAPLGPGPIQTTVVMARGEGEPWHPQDFEVLLGDIRTGKTWTIGKKDWSPLLARAGKLVYSVKEDGSKNWYVADIKLPEELRERKKKTQK
jgi:hypothetical protein